jgi:hypothetical protein
MPATVTTTLYRFGELAPGPQEKAVTTIVKLNRLWTTTPADDYPAIIAAVTTAFAEKLGTPDPDEINAVPDVVLRNWNLTHASPYVAFGGRLSRENAPSLPWEPEIEDVHLDGTGPGTCVGVSADIPEDKAEKTRVAKIVRAMQDAVFAAVEHALDAGKHIHAYLNSPERWRKEAMSEANPWYYLADGTIYQGPAPVEPPVFDGRFRTITAAVADGDGKKTVNPRCATVEVTLDSGEVLTVTVHQSMLYANTLNVEVTGDFIGDNPAVRINVNETPVYDSTVDPDFELEDYRQVDMPSTDEDDNEVSGATLVQEIDGFTVGDLVMCEPAAQGLGGPWKIARLYVPTDGGAPYGGLEDPDNPNHGTATPLRLLHKVDVNGQQGAAAANA